jgi:hypothetical protein
MHRWNKNPTISPNHNLPIPLTYRPTYLPIHNLPTYRSTTYLPTDLPTDPQPTYLPTYLSTYLPIDPPTDRPTYLPTDLPTYRPTYLSTYLPTDRPTTDPPSYLLTYWPIYLSIHLPTYYTGGQKPVCSQIIPNSTIFWLILYFYQNHGSGSKPIFLILDNHWWTPCIMHRCVYLTVHITKWCSMILVSQLLCLF